MQMKGRRTTMDGDENEDGVTMDSNEEDET
jgi:hypothetical protein